MARKLAEVDEAYGSVRGGSRLVDAVGIIDDRNALGDGLAHQRRDAVGADRGNDDGVVTARNAVIHLIELGRQVPVAAGFEQLQVDVVAPRLGHEAETARDPIHILHLREQGAEPPGLGDF